MKTNKPPFVCFAGLPNVKTTEEWLVETLPPNSRIGIDPFLIEATRFERLSATLQQHGHTLVAIQQNLVDLVWTHRPEQRLPELEVLEKRFSGTFQFNHIQNAQ